MAVRQRGVLSAESADQVWTWRIVYPNFVSPSTINNPAPARAGPNPLAGSQHAYSTKDHGVVPQTFVVSDQLQVSPKHSTFFESGLWLRSRGRLRAHPTYVFR